MKREIDEIGSEGREKLTFIVAGTVDMVRVTKEADTTRLVKLREAVKSMVEAAMSAPREGTRE